MLSAGISKLNKVASYLSQQAQTLLADVPFGPTVVSEALDQSEPALNEHRRRANLRKSAVCVTE